MGELAITSGVRLEHSDKASSVSADTSPGLSLRQQKPTVSCTRRAFPPDEARAPRDQVLRNGDRQRQLPLPGSRSLSEMQRRIRGLQARAFDKCESSVSALSSPIAAGSSTRLEHRCKLSVVSAPSSPIAAGSAARLEQVYKLSVRHAAVRHRDAWFGAGRVAGVPLARVLAVPKVLLQRTARSSSRSFRSAARSSSNEPCILSRRLPHRASDARQPDAPLRARARQPLHVDDVLYFAMAKSAALPIMS